jgi:hypothetical protein
MNGSSRCYPVILTAEEASVIANSVRRRNLDLCRAGSPNCDPTLLNQAEAAQVRGVINERNLQRCINGAANCDPLAFSARHGVAVAEARRARNLENCVNGFFSKCDLSALTAPELASVAPQHRRGNSSSTYNSFAALLSLIWWSSAIRRSRHLKPI